MLFNILINSPKKNTECLWLVSFEALDVIDSKQIKCVLEPAMFATLWYIFLKTALISLT